MVEKTWKKLEAREGKVLLTVFMVIFLIAVMVVGDTTAMADEPKVIKLKYASALMPQDPVNVLANQTFDLVEKKTNGRVKIERFIGGTLGGPFEELGLVKSGSVDIITLWIDYFPQELPLHGITTTTQVISGEQALANVTALTREIPETRVLLEAEQKRNNLKVLYWNCFGRSGITARFPVKSLADLKGKKLNTIASFHRPIFKELGWIPVNVQIPELYEAMSRGVIDAIIMCTTGVLPLKWYEIAKAHLVLSENNMVNLPLALNLDVWNRLPGDIQQAFMEASLEVAQLSIQIEKDTVKKTYDVFEKSGVPVVRVLEGEDKAFWDLDGKFAMETYMANAQKMGVKDQAVVIQKYWNDMRVGKWQK